MERWWWAAAGAVLLAAGIPGVTRWDVTSLETSPSDWEAKNVTWTHQRDLVLVAGLSRTGTSSLQAALAEMNLTVFHTLETMTHHFDFWYYYLNGAISKPNVAALIEPLHVDALSDCWFAHLAPEILHVYPNTKVILTTRDSKSWLRSYGHYIATSDLYHWHRQVRRLVASRISHLLGLGKIFRFGRTPTKGSSSGLDLDKLPMLMDIWQRIDTVIYGSSKIPNPLWRSGYDRHNAFIRSIVPKENLLEFSLAQGHGWSELLDFLHDRVPPTSRTPAALSPFPASTASLRQTASPIAPSKRQGDTKLPSSSSSSSSSLSSGGNIETWAKQLFSDFSSGFLSSWSVVPMVSFVVSVTFFVALTWSSSILGLASSSFLLALFVSLSFEPTTSSKHTKKNLWTQHSFLPVHHPSHNRPTVVRLSASIMS